VYTKGDQRHRDKRDEVYGLCRVLGGSGEQRQEWNQKRSAAHAQAPEHPARKAD